MKRTWAVCSLMTASLAVPAAFYTMAWGAPPAPAAAAYQEPAWDVPPAEFREAQRKGFHEGVEAARKDYDHHLAPEVERHGEFRHPPVDCSMHEDFRDGFRRGYETAMQHLAMR